MARRLAVAATLVVGSSAALMLYNSGQTTQAPMSVAVRPAAAVRPAVLASRPVIENYESQNATIVEVPAETQTNVKVVMIFDETLPADYDEANSPLPVSSSCDDRAVVADPALPTRRRPLSVKTFQLKHKDAEKAAAMIKALMSAKDRSRFSPRRARSSSPTVLTI
jgi:hypothetical protein